MKYFRRLATPVGEGSWLVLHKSGPGPVRAYLTTGPGPGLVHFLTYCADSGPVLSLDGSVPGPRYCHGIVHSCGIKGCSFVIRRGYSKYIWNMYYLIIEGYPSAPYNKILKAQYFHMSPVIVYFSSLYQLIPHRKMSFHKGRMSLGWIDSPMPYAQE